MRNFENIAQLIRTKRTSHSKSYSQSELSHLLGYKNGQFISNVERALCNIPLKMLRKVSEVLEIPIEEIKAAVLKDQEQTLDIYLKDEGYKIAGIVGSELSNKEEEDEEEEESHHKPGRSAVR